MKRGVPDTSLYKPRPISAPRTRPTAAAMTTAGSTGLTASARSASDGCAAAAPALSGTSTRSASATAATLSRLAKPTMTRAAASTASTTSTASKPSVSASRLSRTAPSLSATTGTTRSAARSTAASTTTTAAPARTATRTATGVAAARPTTSTMRAARTPLSSAAMTSSSSKRAAGKLQAPPLRHVISVAARSSSTTSNNNQDELNGDTGGYPACMEIEGFEDAVSATESAYSVLAATSGELNIITAVRLRPMSSAERLKGYRRVVDMPPSERNLVRIVNPIALAPSAQYTPLPPASSRPATLQQRAASAAAAPSFPPQFTHEFRFDHTFWSFDRDESRSVASQSSIYDQLGLFTIENALQGYNCSVFAYGQTSAGKTYTMMGSDALASTSGASPTDADATSRRGLIPRICRGVFDQLELNDDDCTSNDFSVHVSYIEIYHERAYDLLQVAALAAIGGSSSGALNAKESLKVRESPETGVFVERANQVRVTSFDDIKLLLDEGNRVRSVATTSANARSSRSHAILTLTLKQTLASAPTEIRRSKICLVDLAGSERADASGTNGARLREAGSINKSLATLADVIGALSKRSSAASLSAHQQHSGEPHFVPYRNSILTRLLKESLGGNAKTIMLAAISPCCAHYDESLSTLKYIERAKSVVNVARVNAESCGSPELVHALQREIVELKARLEVAKASTLSLPPSPSLLGAVTGVSYDEEYDNDDKNERDAGIASACAYEVHALALALEDELTELPPEVASALSSHSAPPSSESVESPIYTSSLCFDEKEKSRLEREVAKLKVQLRKREREFHAHEHTSKALSDSVSAQALRQQARMINLLALHDKFVSLVKLRALVRWRFSTATNAVDNVGASISCSSINSVDAIGIDKNVMTDTETNNDAIVAQEREQSHAPCARCAAADAKRNFVTASSDEEDPACSADDESSEELALALKRKQSSHRMSSSDSGTSAGAFLLDPKKRGFAVAGRQHVDVICSSIVTDFFGDSAQSMPLTKLSEPHKAGGIASKVSTQSVVAASKAKSSNRCKSSSDDNQLEQLVLLPTGKAPQDTGGNDEQDDAGLVSEAESSAALLIDAIIDHEAGESNQAHDSDSVKRKLVEGLDETTEQDPSHSDSDDNEEPFEEDEDSDGDSDSDDDDDANALEDEPAESDSPNDQRHTQLQRAQSMLARCIDAIDIARKGMGPAIRKLKQTTDRSAVEHDGKFLVGTGLERQLLAHADRTLVAVSQHVSNLSDLVAASASTDEDASDSTHAHGVVVSNGVADFELYDQFESLLSDFCLQTMGHICDQLTTGAAGTSALARDAIEKLLDALQSGMHGVLASALCGADTRTRASPTRDLLLVASLMELYALSERIRFAWHAIDQKNRQRMVLVTLAQHQHQQALAASSATTSPAKMRYLEAQNKELRTAHDALVAKLEVQTVEFAQREEQDRIALLLSTHKLEQEHEERVCELEHALGVATESIHDLEERLLAQASKVELLEQELELAAVVRTTNELLHSDVGSELSGTSSDTDDNAHAMQSDPLSSPPSSQCMIVKLEEELASALYQINELGTGTAVGVGDCTGSSKDPDSAATAATGSVDREMIEYMERTSEIEKQNNEAISKLHAAIDCDFGAPSDISDVSIGGGVLARRRSLEATAAALSVEADAALVVSTDDPSASVGAAAVDTVTTIKRELAAALTKAETLEEQHMKLMVSFETQTDHVLHLEEALYESQVQGKAADDALAASRERLSAVEHELEATTALAKTLRDDLHAAMSELCVVECKCGMLEAQCGTLSESAQASADAVTALQHELADARSRVGAVESERSLAASQRSVPEAGESTETLFTRCNELETALKALQLHCSTLEQARAEASTERSDTLADTEQRLVETETRRAELADRCELLAAQQQTATARAQTLQEQLAVAETRSAELEAQMRHQDNELVNMGNDLDSARRAHTALEHETATLRADLSSAQLYTNELTAKRAELFASAQSQTQEIQRLEADAAMTGQQLDDLAAVQQQQREHHENEAQKMVSTLDVSLQRVVQLETQYAEILCVCEELRLCHQAAEARCVEVESERAALQHRSDAAEAELTALEYQHQHEVGDLESQATDLRAQIDTLESLNGDLRAQIDAQQLELVHESAASAALYAEVVELRAVSQQLVELEVKHRDAAERVATQTAAITQLTQQLHSAQDQNTELHAAMRQQQETLVSDQIAELTEQLEMRTTEMASLEFERSALVAAAAAYVTRIHTLEQENTLKTSALAALKAEHKDAVASCISLNTNILHLETQLSSAHERISALDLALDTVNTEAETLQQSAYSKAEQSRAVDLERLTRMQTELDGAQQRMTQLQAELDDYKMASTHEQSELVATHARTETREAHMREQLQALQDEHDGSVISHAAEVEAIRVELQAAVERSDSIEARSANDRVTLEVECAALRTAVERLETQLDSAQLRASQIEEAHDAQTLLLAEAEDARSAAVVRADLLEEQLHAQRSVHDEKLSEARAAFEAQQLELQQQAGATAVDAAARISALEHRIHEMSWESGEYELQISLATQRHEQELRDAHELAAAHSQAQLTQHSKDTEALQRDLETKIVLLSAEISERVTSAQNLQQHLERTQSTHAAELAQCVSRHSSMIIELRQQRELAEAAAKEWERKCHELEACVSPDAVRKVKAQIDAAVARANESEATYRIELESKLQLEFDLASTQKELRDAQQQLTELQWRELEQDAHDPSAATRRSLARENELAMLAKEREALHAQSTQVAKREAAVKLLEASATTRLGDLQQQLQTCVRELEAATVSNTALKAERVQTQERLQALSVQVATLTQKLAEATNRSEMQCEELLSFKARVALDKTLLGASAYSSTYGDANTLALDDASGSGSAGHKTLSPEARHLLLKHLNSLDLWFERAILGKTPGTAASRSSARRASLLAVLEDNELLTSISSSDQQPPPRHLQGARDDERDIDASDADAVPVEVEQLTDEVLSMRHEPPPAPVHLQRSKAEVSRNSGDGTSSDRVAAAARVAPPTLPMCPSVDDLETMFDRDMQLSEARSRVGFDAGASDGAYASTVHDRSNRRGSERMRGSTDLADGSEVAQLKLTVLRLKQALDAKEEAVCFLDDKMRYYEELLQRTSTSPAAS